jgi:hypothetical protein
MTDPRFEDLYFSLSGGEELALLNNNKTKNESCSTRGRQSKKRFRDGLFKRAGKRSGHCVRHTRTVPFGFAVLELDKTLRYGI